MLSLRCDIKATENLQQLRQRNELCDLVIESSDGKQTLAHSCVLASHSSVIAAVLQSRVVAEHDWSILRPLIINIEEVSVTVSSKEDSEGNANIIEKLVRLMYGEAVLIPDNYVPILNEYSRVLGLSDQIVKCLNGSKNKNVRDVQINSDQIDIEEGDKESEMEYEHIEELNEINLENQIFHPAIQKLSMVKPLGNDSDVGTCEVKENPESVITFPILCAEGEDEDEASCKAWQDGTLSCEKTPNVQGQKCNVVVCKMDPDSVEVIDGLESKNEDNSAILNITLNNHSTENSYCNEIQTLPQRKKHARKSFICLACDAAFQKCCDFVKHVQTLQHYSVQCPLCFIQIEDIEGQRAHFAEHNQELPFFCIYCNLRFRTRAALTMHAPKHSTVKPFVCNDCGRGFKWRHALHAHLLTHSPTSRLLCDICGFSSKYVSSFKAHLLQHTGQSFPCSHPGCSFTSNRKTHLNDHLATHSKTRVHQCEVCGHSFSHARNMHRHMRLHAPASNLLTCVSISKIQCNFRTTRLDKLRDHLLKKHNMEYSSLPSTHIPKSKLVKSATVIPSNHFHSFDKSTVDDVNQMSVPRNIQTCSLSQLENYDHSSVEVKSSSFEESNRLTFQGSSDIITVNKYDQNNKLELVSGTKNGDETLQSSNIIDKNVNDSNRDEHFSALINSNIVELPEIQTLQTHSEQSEKEQRVAAISESFPPVFFIEPEILLEDTQSSGMARTSLSSKGQIHILQTSALPESSHKVLSVGCQENDRQINIIDEHTVGALSLSDPCTLTESPGNPSMEVAGDSTAEASVSGSLADRSLKEVASEKEEQCMESLSILDFMLNNVTN